MFKQNESKRTLNTNSAMIAHFHTELYLIIEMCAYIQEIQQYKKYSHVKKTCHTTTYG